MLAALFVFVLLVYGLACLVADAKLFGCPAKSFYADPTDEAYIREHSVLPLRQFVMRWRWCGRWVQLLLTCYLCLGVWCGAAIHLSLVGLFRLDPSVPLLSSYPLLSHTTLGVVICTALAAVAGGAACYVLDLSVQVLENKVALQEHAVEASDSLSATEKLEIVDRDAQ